MISGLGFLFFLLVGKVFIFLIQTFAHSQTLSSEFLKKLIFCDLCLGFWTYLVLSCFLGNDWIKFLFGVTYPFIGNVITAGISTFVMHIFSIGWKVRFSD